MLNSAVKGVYDAILLNFYLRDKPMVIIGNLCLRD